MRLWIGLHLHQLPLEAFEPQWSSDGVSVVLEHEKVLGMSRAARAAGIKHGMRRGGVLMLVPDARVHERSIERESAALHAVAMALLKYTPLVTLAEESSLLVEIGGSLTLFGGIRALCRLIRADLRALGFSGRVSCAPTARGAWLLARTGSRRLLKAQTMARHLDRLLVLAIPAARPFASWFEGIGCETIADLRRLPRAGLQRRCGRQLLDTLDSALGSAPELFEWIEAPTTFEAKIELFDRIENADLLLAGAQRLILELVGWLCSRQMAVERVTVFLEHERGREKRPATAVDVALSEPTWHSEHIVRLLKEKFGKVELVAPVIGMALDATHLQPMAPLSQDLFAEPGGTEEDQKRVMELLVARLGADRVLQPSPVADYRPEVANAWVSVQEKLREASVLAQLPPDLQATTRPAWLLAKPIALLVRDHRPYYTSPLRMISGPERVEAGWWSNAASRDYFIAEGQGDHSLYWVYRERLSNADDDGDRKWFLHGLFG
ncbi:Y-family DNA polymerase [Massilia aerilata]|uniref:Y-family DNA polymerase n=1 Tax=Massilia aerilata TaxID=453817 RepID=A0ABW0S049_9BURK